MVVHPRSETRRNRVIHFLTLTLSVFVLIIVISGYGQASQVTQFFYVLLGIGAIAAIVMVLIQLYSFPKRSHALIIHRDGEMVIATNAVHESFKLRHLRDVLSENVFAFSDEDRERLKPLESDGYFPAMLVRNVRKVLLLRLCTMMFDDVYVVDQSDRWEHYDCSDTAEPTFNKREMPPLRTWKGTDNISA